ncbi:creatinine amidohydrolase [Halorientalis persicus]|uniref:Creatinine amidohydrolase n=2 Tax=Halorientalis TaxID=1073987 RepID=A0A1G7RW43_9EURY|nr:MULTISPECIES: creatininase family protein [Halorientalis]SDG14968.1 creatinine amidohydrolase [Halorientalis regularis]SEO50932.1 creatinine amidohydrolase [Halorientalis persicus]
MAGNDLPEEWSVDPSERHRAWDAVKVRQQSWTDIAESDIDVCLLPVGSIEQHGPHGPLGTDVLIAEAIAEATAGRVEALTLPAVQAGIAPYHGNFPGTLDIPADVFRDYTFHVLESTEAWGIETVVTVNGHGGNRTALKAVCRQLRRETALDAQYWAWTDAVDEDVSHAGEAETSVLRYLVPELVGTPQKGDTESWGEWIHGAQVAGLTDEFSENGVVGDPTSASAAKGQRLFETAVDELTALIEWLRENEQRSTDVKSGDVSADRGTR